MAFRQSHFELYSQYQQTRHKEPAVHQTSAQDDIEQYKQFLCQSNVESLMIEFVDASGRLKMVSVVDIVQDGVSAVYTFYDASQHNTSYGTYSIMWLSQWAISLQLPFLYLGYWIQDSQKMAYKQQFKQQERLINGEWTPAS